MPDGLDGHRKPNPLAGIPRIGVPPPGGHIGMEAQRLGKLADRIEAMQSLREQGERIRLLIEPMRSAIEQAELTHPAERIGPVDVEIPEPVVNGLDDMEIIEPASDETLRELIGVAQQQGNALETLVLLRKDERTWSVAAIVLMAATLTVAIASLTVAVVSSFV